MEKELRHTEIKNLLEELKLNCTSDLGKIFAEDIYNLLIKTDELTINDIHKFTNLCADYDKKETLTQHVVKILMFIKINCMEELDYI